jgi:hypothetical protein
LPKGWSREKFAEDIVDEQFVAFGSRTLFGASKPVYFIVQECVGLAEAEVDYRSLFARSGFEAPKAPLVQADEADWHRITRVHDEVVDGHDLVWRSELLVVEGSVLHVRAWASRSDRKVLDSKVEELLDTVEVPGPDSPRGRAPATSRETITRGEVAVSFEIRPFVLRPEPDEDALRTWQTADERQGIRVCEMREQPSAAAVLEQEVREMRTWDATYREVRRANRTIDGVECLEQWGAIDSASYRVLVVPCGARRWLVARYWSDGAPEVARPARDALFASVRIGKVAALAGLPQVPPAPWMTLRRPAAVTAFLNGTQRRLAHRGYVRSWRPDLGEAWLACDWRGVHRFTADGQVKSLCQANGAQTVVPWDGGYLVTGMGWAWRVTADQPPVPQPFAFDLAVTTGGDLLGVRVQRSAWRTDGGYPGATRSEFVRRTATASETRLAAIDGEVSDLVATADGSRVLVASSTTNEGTDLGVLEPATGRLTPLAKWTRIASLAPASTGWLVNGKPDGQPFGIWHLQPDGAPTLLLGGGHVNGVQLRGEELWVAFHDGEDAVLAMAPLAHCKATGTSLVPVECDAVAAIGERLLARVPTAPRTQAELDAAFAVVQELARERLGRELAWDADAIDGLCGGDATQLGAGGRVVVAQLLVARARADGARWVEPAGASWLDWVVAAPVVDDNPYVVAQHLPTMLVAAIDDFEGDGEPAHRLAEPRGGRALLCGVDVRTLRAAAAACVPASYGTAADPAAWIAVARGEPANSRLRAVMHERLTNAGAWRQLAEFARDAVAAPGASVDDHVAWLLARERLVASANAVDPELERDLLAALRLHGREVRLWWQLAEYYERQSPIARDRARVCWERVLEVRSWGAAADAANAALQRLDTVK